MALFLHRYLAMDKHSDQLSKTQEREEAQRRLAEAKALLARIEAIIYEHQRCTKQCECS
jgi:hypothetical protein